MAERITSVCRGNNAGLISLHVAPLWIGEDDRVLDLTYGLGNWWTGFKPQHFVTFRGNFTRLQPRFKGQFDVVVYDPPYVSVGGRETQGPAGREMSRRYGMTESKMSPVQNRALIDKGFGNAWRYLVEDGLLMVKCSDYISSGHYTQGHRGVVEMAAVRGMEQVDEFIHVTGTGPQPLIRGGEPLDQQHSHRAHSILCVFKKVL